MTDQPAEGLDIGADGRCRCRWGAGDALYRSYHDAEWGRPVATDNRLFEKICLEGFQSGLSWLTILRKREDFRRAFAGFDPAIVARFDDDDVARLLADASIVRHQGKIRSTINNAQRALEVQAEFGSLAAYFWGFEPGPDSRPTSFDLATLRQVTTSPAAIALSKDLKKRGWTFVGPTTVYAFMQAMGLVNDHLAGCFVRLEATAARDGFLPPVRNGRSA